MAKQSLTMPLETCPGWPESVATEGPEAFLGCILFL